MQEDGERGGRDRNIEGTINYTKRTEKQNKRAMSESGQGESSSV